MIYDVAIIGAGPCGLAVAARLRERTPAALFTNDEHARYWKTHRKHTNSLEAENKKGKCSTTADFASKPSKEPTARNSEPSMIVLDQTSDEWLAVWKQRFTALRISHLRSPLFFHPDPRDRDGLLAFAHEHERLDELTEIPNVVNKGRTKHEKKQSRIKRASKKTAIHLLVDGRDRIDYFTPSRALFEDYCDNVVENYHLQGLVRKRKVLDVRYDEGHNHLHSGIFTIKTNADELNCRTIVIAIGSDCRHDIKPRVPLSCTKQLGSVAHALNPDGTSLPIHVKRKISEGKTTNILIIGGGLTSAQLVDLFITKYAVSKIYLLLRSQKLKTKHFDVDLPWVTKTRNHKMAEFWSADTDQERLQMLQQARNGGSITPTFTKILLKHVAAGRVHIHLSTQINLDDSCHWDQNTNTWTCLNTKPEIAELPPIDHIVYATGSPTNFANVEFLNSMRRDHKLDTLSGLPVLNTDLMWNADIPCFFTGAMAALRLGPGAANLAGAKQGAERIAWKIEELLGGFDAGSTVMRKQADHETAGSSKSHYSRNENLYSGVDSANPFNVLVDEKKSEEKEQLK